MNIAVFCPNWIGDVVMATPALLALRRRYQRARIIGVLRSYVAGVLEGGDWFNESLLTDGPESPGGLIPAARRLRQVGIDLAVLFPNSFRSALLARMGGSRRVLGYARGGRGWLLTERLEPKRGDRGRLVPSPILDAYNRLAVAAGCPEPGRRMLLYTTAADEAAADRLWSRNGFQDSKPVVALNPGAAFGWAKHWPVEYFGQLAARLVQEREAVVLVLCGPEERVMARTIVALAQEPRVHSLAGEEISLGLLKACVRRADLLITTDSGPRHFAAAFGRPVVTLFGPTHIAWTETYFTKAMHLQVQVDCGPCQRRTCPLDHRCMKLLTPGEVFAAACRVLDRERPASLRRAS
jgi:heptosyltransferase-2